MSFHLRGLLAQTIHLKILCASSRSDGFGFSKIRSAIRSYLIVRKEYQHHDLLLEQVLRILGYQTHAASKPVGKLSGWSSLKSFSCVVCVYRYISTNLAKRNKPKFGD